MRYWSHLRTQKHHLIGYRTEFVKAIQNDKYFLPMTKSQSISSRFPSEMDKMKHQQSDQKNYDNSSCNRRAKWTTCTVRIMSFRDEKNKQEWPLILAFLAIFPCVRLLENWRNYTAPLSPPPSPFTTWKQVLLATVCFPRCLLLDESQEKSTPYVTLR